MKPAVQARLASRAAAEPALHRAEGLARIETFVSSRRAPIAAGRAVHTMNRSP